MDEAGVIAAQRFSKIRNLRDVPEQGDEVAMLGSIANIGVLTQCRDRA